MNEYPGLAHRRNGESQQSPSVCPDHRLNEISAHASPSLLPGKPLAAARRDSWVALQAWEWATSTNDKVSDGSQPTTMHEASFAHKRPVQQMFGQTEFGPIRSLVFGPSFTPVRR